MSSRVCLLACHVSFVPVEFYHLIHCMLSPSKHFLRALHRFTIRRRLFTIEVHCAYSRMTFLISTVVTDTIDLNSLATWLLSMACCYYCYLDCCSRCCCLDCCCCYWHCSQFLFYFVLPASPHQLGGNVDVVQFLVCK